MNEGDIYIRRIPDGRYVAVRVLRMIEKSSLVSTTPYLAEERPTLTDPVLRRSVAQERFFYREEPARAWHTGKPTKDFELLGNIPPSPEESQIECNSYRGKWYSNTGQEAFLEWRWKHDRPAFEEEMRKKDEELQRLRRLPQKPKKMMEEDEFWTIIAMLDWNHQGNDEKALAPAVNALAAKTKTDICRFEERFAYLLYQLDTKAHASNMGKDSYDPKSNYVSADGFLYARRVVVANGRDFYNAVLNDPTKMPKDMEFESLLGLASAAYEQKTGEDLDYITGCSYESFSNPDGWK